MVLCKYCGQENPDENLFCQQCGKSIIEQKPPVGLLSPQLADSTDTYTLPKRGSRWVLIAGVLAFMIFFCLLGFVIGSFSRSSENPEVSRFLSGAPVEVQYAVSWIRQGLEWVEEELDLFFDRFFPRPVPDSQIGMVQSTVEPTNTPFQPQRQVAVPTPDNPLVEAVPTVMIAVPGGPMFSDWIYHEGEVVAVQRIDISRNIDYLPAGVDKIFFSMYIVAKNTGRQQMTVDPSAFRLVDSSGSVKEAVLFPSLSPAFGPCEADQEEICEGWWTTVIDDKPEIRENMSIQWLPDGSELAYEVPLRAEAAEAGVITHTVSGIREQAGGGLTCESIRLKRTEYNDSDWSQYKQGLAGQRFDGWPVRVTNTEEHGAISKWYSIDFKTADGCMIYATMPDLQQARRFKTGQQVNVSGVIQSISDDIMGGLSVVVKDETLIAVEE